MSASGNPSWGDVQPAAGRRSGWRRLWPYLALWLLAFGLRVVYLGELSDSPLWSVLMGDADRYDAWAQEIAAGDWLGDGVFYQAPLYPYFLGTLYRLFGHSVAAVRLVQMALGATSCVLIALAGRWVFTRRVGLTAGVLLAVYPPALFFDGLVQKTVLDSFFFCLLLALLGCVSRRPQQSALWLAAGVAWGLLTLTRENMLLLAPVLAAWIGWHRGLAGRRRGVALGWLALGAAAVLLPVAVRNRVAGGEWHLTTAQFGPNFYIGNSTDAEGLYQPLRRGRGNPWYEQIDATQLAEQGAGHPLSPGEVSRYWTARTAAAIRTQGASWVGLLVQKWCLVWNNVETGDTEDIYTHAEESRLLAGLLRAFPFGLLLPLAAVGVWLTRRRWRRLWWLCGVLAVYAASVALFYVFARYRYPLVPVLVLFAAAGLHGIGRLVRRREIVRLIPCAALAAVAAVFAQGIGCDRLFSRWPDLSIDVIRANTHHNIAIRLQELHGARPQIAAEYAVALRLDPENADILATWGYFLLQEGRHAESMRVLRHTLRLDPSLAEAHTNLGVGLWHEGRRAEATACFRQALALDPALIPARADLARACLDDGRVAEALPLLREGLRFAPRNGALHMLLGRAELAQRHYDAAAAALRTALDCDSGLTEAHVLLGIALRRDGHVADALREWRHALKELPAGSAQAAHVRRAIGWFGARSGAAAARRTSHRRAAAEPATDGVRADAAIAEKG